MLFKRNFPHTQQLESKDCGPACLQMICKYYGAFYELEYLREITGIRKEGISVYDYITAAEKLGLHSLAFRVSYRKFREEVPLPCTVHWKGHHFVVVYKITKRYIYVSDPQNGLLRYRLKEFAKGWLAHIESNDRYKKGVCIVSEITQEFQQTENRKPSNSYLELIKYIWRYVHQYKSSIFKIMLIMLVVTLVSALLPIITQSIIDIGIPTKNQSFVTLMLISSVVMTLSSSTAAWIKQLISTHFAARMKISMQSEFVNKLFKLPIVFFENRLMGDIMQRSFDYDRIESMVMGTAFNFILAILQLTIFGGILFVYNTLIFWIYAAFAVFYIIWILFFWAIRKKMDIRVFTFQAQNQSHWIEILSKMVDIKSYNYARNKRWQWEKTQVSLFKTRIKLLNVDQLQNVGSALLTSFRDILLIYIASLAVMQGEITIGVLIAIQFILGQLRTPMDSIIDFVVSIQLTKISYMRISEINNIPPEEKETIVQTDIIDYQQDIILQNVFYKYSINDEFILKGLTCNIPKGKMIAIVGESGCGKSTLIKILTRLYIPSAGFISLGNLKINSIPSEEWHSRCGVITQESTLLKDSIMNNIVFGRKFEPEKLIKAVSLANIKNEIERMPLSYNTQIRENEKGVSEGQKQRILFARAIYGEPDYLFLDEVTSSLDSNNEFSIIQSIKNNPNRPTIVIAAHRLSSIRNADLIIVLKDGTIKEIGTHKNLLSLGKEYFRLFNSQLEIES